MAAFRQDTDSPGGKSPPLSPSTWERAQDYVKRNRVREWAEESGWVVIERGRLMRRLCWSIGVIVLLLLAWLLLGPFMSPRIPVQSKPSDIHKSLLNQRRLASAEKLDRMFFSADDHRNKTSTILRIARAFHATHPLRRPLDSAELSDQFARYSEHMKRAKVLQGELRSTADSIVLILEPAYEETMKLLQDIRQNAASTTISPSFDTTSRSTVCTLLRAFGGVSEDSLNSIRATIKGLKQELMAQQHQAMVVRTMSHGKRPEIEAMRNKLSDRIATDQSLPGCVLCLFPGWDCAAREVMFQALREYHALLFQALPWSLESEKYCSEMQEALRDYLIDVTKAVNLVASIVPDGECGDHGVQKLTPDGQQKTILRVLVAASLWRVEALGSFLYTLRTTA